MTDNTQYDLGTTWGSGDYTVSILAPDRAKITLHLDTESISISFNIQDLYEGRVTYNLPIVIVRKSSSSPVRRIR